MVVFLLDSIQGLFTGKVDPASCSFRQHMREGEPYIHLQIKKAAAAGTLPIAMDWHILIIFAELVKLYSLLSCV